MDGMPRPLWQCVVVALLPLVTVLLGGGTERWSQAYILIAVGMFLAVAPPRVSAGRTLNLMLVGLLLLAGTAFLPAHWFQVPPWRAALTDDFGFVLPDTLSPQPILSAESVVIFLLGAAWFYLMVAFRWQSAERLRAGRVFAGGVIAISALFLVLHKLDIMPPIWHNERRFGTFPNRNQTADFLAASSVIILACAHLRWQTRHRAEAVGWMLGWCVVLVALFASYSRAGIIMLFAEVGLYLLVEVRRSVQRHALSKTQGPNLTSGSPRFAFLNIKLGWIAAALSLLMLLLSLFLFFGGSTLERLWPTSARTTAAAVTGDFRLRIQADALQMIDASPWRGFGLGSFAEVFAIFRRQSAVPARAIHPESDYLWVAAELGWPALLLVIAGMFYLGRRIVASVRTSGTGKDRKLRLAAALAVAAIMMHGFVDVSAHRLGTMFCALFFLGLALKDHRVETRKIDKDAIPTGTPLSTLSGSWIMAFRGAGLFLACVGILFLCEERGSILLPGQIASDKLRARAVKAAAEKNYAPAQADASRALGYAPLDWSLYFMRASTGIYLGRDRDDIAADFRRARYLEPYFGELPQTESSLWLLAGERTLAISALGEACRREPLKAGAYIMGAMSNASHDKLFLEDLADFTRHDPAMIAAYLTPSDSPDTPGYIAAILSDDPDLRRLNPTQKTTFFRAWAQRGTPATLLAAMPQHPGWQASGWRWWATAAAKTGNEEQACALAGQWTPKPTVPPLVQTGIPVEEMRRQAALQPTDPARALQAYLALGVADDWSNARLALQGMKTQPDCPSYFHYLEAIACGKMGDWKRGWDAWDHYFSAAHLQD